MGELGETAFGHGPRVTPPVTTGTRLPALSRTEPDR